jgi:hypothetical protein
MARLFYFPAKPFGGFDARSEHATTANREQANQEIH